MISRVHGFGSEIWRLSFARRLEPRSLILSIQTRLLVGITVKLPVSFLVSSPSCHETCSELHNNQACQTPHFPERHMDHVHL